jgi:cytochrome P450
MPAAAPDLSYKSPFVGWPSRFFSRLSLVGYQISCYFQNHPGNFIWAFTLLRKWRPVALFRGYVFVVKARDVRDVLTRIEDFTIADVLGPQMPWGPFMLDVDWPEQHTLEREFLQKVVEFTDVEIVRHRAATMCRDLIAKSQIKSGSGPLTINVVADLCEPVVVDMIEYYFGVPDIGKKYPNKKNMAGILGDVAGFFVAPPPPESQPWLEALESIDRLSKEIVDRIKSQLKCIKGQSGKRPKTHLAPDLLTRLLEKKVEDGRSPPFLDEDWIRRYVTGLAVFGGGTITRATTHAIDQLLEYPEHLKSARELAKQINKENEHLDSAGAPEQHCLEFKRYRLRQIIYEALRFRPMLPLLVRYTPRETVIGKGSSDARLVPMGKRVIAVAIAAMFDPEEFADPRDFKCNRSLKKYLHYGPETGPRRCFGKYVADVLIVEIISALLICCKELTRVSGWRGRIKYYLGGPAPQSLFITCT